MTRKQTNTINLPLLLKDWASDKKNRKWHEKRLSWNGNKLSNSGNFLSFPKFKVKLIRLFCWSNEQIGCLKTTGLFVCDTLNLIPNSTTKHIQDLNSDIASRMLCILLYLYFSCVCRLFEFFVSLLTYNFAEGSFFCLIFLSFDLNVFYYLSSHSRKSINHQKFLSNNKSIWCFIVWFSFFFS